jgi:hypothetical protein
VPHQGHAALAEQRLLLPRDVFAKKSHRSDRGPGAQIAERGKTPKWVATEQIAPVLSLEMTPRERAARRSAKKPKCHQLVTSSAIHIDRRAESACAIVTPSAYSRSPPTGRPRAIRVTVSRYGDSLR